jgi:hypothetical protein
MSREASLGVSEMHVNANSSDESGEKDGDGHPPVRECSSNFFQLVPQLFSTFSPCVFNFVYFYFHFLYTCPGKPAVIINFVSMLFIA